MKPKNTVHAYQDESDWLKFKGESKRFASHRQKAHYYFDKIWQNGLMTREESYAWLSERLEINAHFSGMSDEMCAEAIYFCQQALNDNRRLDLDFGEEPVTPAYEI